MILELILSSLIVFVIILLTMTSYSESFTIMNTEDQKNALKYANNKLCKEQGALFLDNGNDGYECVHTEESCLKGSVYPTREGMAPSYYEWRKNGTADANNLGVSAKNDRGVAGGVCIMGNEMYRSFCESNKLKYNPVDGTCKTTKQYCKDRLLYFKDGDCYQDPVSWTLTQGLGDTLGRPLTGWVAAII